MLILERFLITKIGVIPLGIAPIFFAANYIEKGWYSEIIYNSTVDTDNKGLNLVLFERYDVEPYGSVKSHGLL